MPVEELKVMTYNLWNYQNQWPRRRALLLDLLQEEQPDVIGFQELRSDPEGDEEGRHQVQQIADRLLGYEHVCQWVYGTSALRVGQAIFSRYPIAHMDYIPLPRDPADPRDRHRRILQRAVIDLPWGPLQVFNIHLSLSEAVRCRSVVQVDAFIRRVTDSGPQVLLGDFNAPPAARSISFLKGDVELEGQTGFFRDTWAEANPDDDGHTWPADPELVRPTWRGPLPIRGFRCDYILVGRGGRQPAVSQCRLVGDTPAEDSLCPSDHKGLVAVLHFP